MLKFGKRDKIYTEKKSRLFFREVPRGKKETIYRDNRRRITGLTETDLISCMPFFRHYEERSDVVISFSLITAKGGDCHGNKLPRNDGEKR